MNNVSVHINNKTMYPDCPPYSPSEEYPEFIFKREDVVSENNPVYHAVRDMLKNLGLDEENYGTPKWNPFCELINKGDTVLLKPNFVYHDNAGDPDIQSLVTHGAVIRPIIDYVLLALQGTGKIIIADAPQANADFETIVERNGVKQLVDYYNSKNVMIELIDLRKNAYVGGFDTGLRVDLKGDPRGYVLCNLEDKSMLQDVANLDRLYGADYDRNFIVKQHTNGHRYLFSRSVLDADVVISIPKLKTHRKAGVTINSKNMVGANGDKNFLAHYRVGSPADGGDEFADDVGSLGRLHYKWRRFAMDNILIKNTKLSRYQFLVMNFPFGVLHRLYKIVTKTDYDMGNGDWHGNDTVWRMCLDLNRILLFADSKGIIHKKPQRKYFCVVDGVVAGEENGPLEPTPKRAGLIAGGTNPFFVDFVCAHLIGFDPYKIPVINNAMNLDGFCYDEQDIRAYCENNGASVDWRSVNLHFKPQANWKGYIER